MSKLNAFLAAIPANGLPSPTTCKTTSVPANKAFPSLTIPQEDDELDDQEEVGGRANPRLKFVQPATPQPQFHRHRTSGGSGSVRSLARKFDLSGSSFDAAIERDEPVPLGEDGSNSNQEDVDEQLHKAAAMVTQPQLPVTQPNTPVKLHAFTAATRRRSSLTDEGEAGPLKRLSVTHQLQQQQQGLGHGHGGQHHRRVSTDTAMFSKMLKKQPHQDIDKSVVQFFAQLHVPTVSRPDQGSNQLEEETATAAVAVDPVEILATFKRGETIAVSAALEILQQATQVMTLESNVVSARAPFTVVGDLHGQFSDLVELFNVHGLPSATNPFLFLGDYVDRGVCSCEIILLLLAFKIRFPAHIHLLRGNHECRSLSTFYGFRNECLKKYGLTAYNRTIKCFESMPLAATITTSFGEFLAVHGGLSPSIQYVQEINDKVDRFVEPDPSGALCDLLWADPAKDAAPQSEAFAPNSVRGCSFTFNEQVCREFLTRNALLAIVRAHELEEDGFREHFMTSADKKEDEVDGDDEQSVAKLVRELPPVITVFSAPEYCNANHNMGATLLIPWAPRAASHTGRRLLEYRQHTRSAHREVEFTGASEHEAVKKYLSEQLPFLPVDFYELVVVCRQLRATLDVAASIATPVPSSASNVLHGSELVLPTLAPVGPLVVDKTRVEERRSVDRTSTEGDERTQQQQQQQQHHQSHAAVHNAAAAASTTAAPPFTYVRTNKPRRRASTGSGLRLCPGFMRFCEKFLGIQFKDSSASQQQRPTFIIAPKGGAPGPVPGPYARPTVEKKRRSIDDINIGSTISTALASTEQEPVAMLTRDDCHHVALPVVPVQSLGKTNVEIFTTAQWSALRLYFSLLDVNATGVLLEESFVVLLAEQDSDAYATQDELELLMDVVDGNGDGLITIQDFLQFAYRAYLRWKKNSAPRLSKV